MIENATANLHGVTASPKLKRVTRLLRRTQDSLHNAFGKSPSYGELEEWTGVAEGTVKDWFANHGRPTAEFLLQLLERIPERSRLEILAQACRLCPTLDHPRLKCDQTVISQLKSMSSQPRGFTLVVGGNGESRSFLLTAMANAFMGLTTRPHKIAGFDVHEPDWFVPLPGVRYLHNLFHQVGLREKVREDWPEVRAGGAQLVVLNGIWSSAPDLHKEVWALAGRAAIIVADPVMLKLPHSKRTKARPTHIITISKHLENAKEIMVAIEAV